MQLSFRNRPWPNDLKLALQAMFDRLAGALISHRRLLVRLLSVIVLLYPVQKFELN